VADKYTYEQLDLEMNRHANEMNKQALETAVKGLEVGKLQSQVTQESLEVGKLQSQVTQESKRFSVIMTVSSQNLFTKPKLGCV
jgi:hypothetical protein